MDLVAYDERARPYLSVRLVALVALLVAVIAAVTTVIWRGSPSAAEQPARGVGSTGTLQVCTRAMAAADAALRDAQVLESAMAIQTTAMNDLLAGRISTQRALDRTLPGLARGAQQSLQLDQDLRVYRSAASGCRVK